MNVNKEHKLFLESIFFLENNCNNDKKNTNILNDSHNKMYKKFIFPKYILKCNKCLKSPEIIIIDSSTIEFECECLHIQNVQIKYIFENLLIRLDECLRPKEEINNFYLCQKHSMKFMAQ